MKKLLSFIFAAGLVSTAAISVSAAYDLTEYDLPSNGVHFSFDGTCTDDSGELVGKPMGTIDFIDGHDGKSNGAVYLDSKDDHIELLKEDFYGNWSISAWVRTDEAVSWAFLTMSEVYSVRPVQCNNLLGEAGVSKHNADDRMFSSGLPLGEWAMYTVVHDYENEEITWYLNGEIMETVDMTIPLAMTLIGNDSDENCGWQVDPYMAIDDLWMFGRMLSESEVKTLYETGAVAQVEEGSGKVENAGNPDKLYPYDVPAEGVHFSFDGTYTDDSGELVGEAQGTIVSVEGRDGTANGAAYFDTADDHIRLMKKDFYGNWSISAWLKLDEYVNYSFLVQSGTHYSVRPCQGNTDGLIGIGDGKNGDMNINAGLPLNEWAMLTVVHNEANGTISFYINGEYAESLERTMPLPLTLIGNDSDACKGWQIDPKMTIDDLWMFGKALTAEEITALYTTNNIKAESVETESAETDKTAEEAGTVEVPVSVEPEETDKTVEEAETVEVPAPVKPEETTDSEPVQKVSPQTADTILLAACFALVSFALTFVFRKVKA